MEVIVKKDSAITIRLNGAVRKAVKEVAKKKGLSTTQFVEKIILENLKMEGIAISRQVTII